MLPFAGSKRRSRKMNVGNRFAAFTTTTTTINNNNNNKTHPKPKIPDLIKSAFCYVQSCVPGPWANAIRHGGQWSCFLSIVRAALLTDHVLATAQWKPDGSGVGISAAVSPRPAGRCAEPPAHAQQTTRPVARPPLANLRQKG